MKARGRAALAGLAAAGAVVALLHTPLARPLLRKLGGCPVGRASAAEVDAAMRGALRATRGTERARDRWALGFTLDRTTARDVRAWAAAEGVRCEERREGALVVCLGATLAGERWDDVAFAFGPADGALVDLAAFRADLAPEEAARAYGALAAALAARVGAPSSGAGEATAAHLAGRGMPTATLAFRRADYVADLSASRLPGRGVALRLQAGSSL